jgi:4-amino-4-deoxy-L-arabinose transferase-like glycosyltransferase
MRVFLVLAIIMAMIVAAVLTAYTPGFRALGEAVLCFGLALASLALSIAIARRRSRWMTHIVRFGMRKPPAG